MSKELTITIDGPSGSGKGTTAKEVAKRLGLTHVDSGALYRAMAYSLHSQNIGPEDDEQITPALEQVSITYDENNEIVIDGKNREREIRTRENSQRTFKYSRNPIIREHSTTLQRQLLENGGVLDGRDAGSVVAPDAELKIYLDCDIDIRTYRRAKQHGITEPLEIAKIKEEITARDEADMDKGDASLRVLSDSVVVDTGHMTIDEQVEYVYQLAKERIDNTK